ncbi:MAG: LysM peptidoglycan-binding domain-containing protein, partial [Clostridia bacterium]|nr:LysM peptidoglycan-binding domain-containing protein [Clostridia bacterium]
LWRKIYNANRDRIKNPDLIRPGWVIRIPKL